MDFAPLRHDAVIGKQRQCILWTAAGLLVNGCSTARPGLRMAQDFPATTMAFLAPRRSTDRFQAAQAWYWLVSNSTTTPTGGADCGQASRASRGRVTRRTASTACSSLRAYSAADLDHEGERPRRTSLTPTEAIDHMWKGR
jgi:hypothetical protein